MTPIAGQDTTKVGCYICTGENPCSEANFQILSSYPDKECYEYLKPVFDYALSTLENWEAGVNVDGVIVQCIL